jgi:hypothetical protein
MRGSRREGGSLFSFQWGASAVLVGVWASILLLIIQHSFPPLVDWPDHMARHYLESLWLSGQSLPAYYKIDYAVTPNLGGDLVVPVLILACGHIAASTIFLVFSVFLYWAGATAFIIQHGNHKKSAFAAACSLLPWLLAATFFWGFMNYYSGVGLAFLAAVNHVRLARLKPLPIWQGAAHAALVVLLYLWHLTSLGIYLVIAACHMLASAVRSEPGTRLRELGRHLPLVASVVPALIIMISVMLTPHLNALSGGVAWRTPLHKLVLVPGFFMAYAPVLDVAVFLIWCVALVLLFRWRSLRSVAIDFVWLSAGTFALLYFALPLQLGGTIGVDIRMLPPLLITCLAILGTLPLSRFAPLGLALVLLAGLVRNASIYVNWSHMAGDARGITNYFSKLEPQQRILVLDVDVPSKTHFQSRLMGWAVLQNKAYVSNLFSGQQPLKLRGPTANFVSTTTGDGQIDDAAVRAKFDYVWVFNPNSANVGIPAGWRFILGEGVGKLWKVQ